MGKARRTKAIACSTPARVTEPLCSSTERSSSAVPSPLASLTKREAMIRTMASTVAIATGTAQRDSQARTSALLLPVNYLSPLVEVELGQSPFDHVLGHLLRNLEVAAAHSDVVEAGDADQLLAADDGQPPHPVLDHQRRR